MKASNLSLPIAEHAIVEKLDEMDTLLASEQEQLKGLRDAFINYIAVTKEIIEELGRAE